jgi:hypothetical protein
VISPQASAAFFRQSNRPAFKIEKIQFLTLDASDSTNIFTLSFVKKQFFLCSRNKKISLSPSVDSVSVRFNERNE